MNVVYGARKQRLPGLARRESGRSRFLNTRDVAGVEEVGVSWAIAMCLPAVWAGHAAVISRIMSRRGFHPLSWFVVALFLGPALWPLAIYEAAAGLPYPEVVRRGEVRPGLHVLVLLDRDDFPDALERQVRRLLPDCGRLVLTRVIRTGGPASIKTSAERYLRHVAHALATPVAELKILYGTIDRVAEEVYEEGGFAFVFRSDDPRELYDGGGQVQKVRCLHGSPAA